MGRHLQGVQAFHFPRGLPSSTIWVNRYDSPRYGTLFARSGGCGESLIKQLPGANKLPYNCQRQFAREHGKPGNEPCNNDLYTRAWRFWGGFSPPFFAGLRTSGRFLVWSNSSIVQRRKKNFLEENMIGVCAGSLPKSTQTIIYIRQNAAQGWSFAVEFWVWFEGTLFEVMSSEGLVQHKTLAW